MCALRAPGLGMEPFDLAGDEKGLIDGVALAGYYDRGRRGRDHRVQAPRLAAWVRRRKQALAGVERVLRGPADLVETLCRASIDRGEVAAEQAWNRTAEPIDRLVRVADNNETRMRLGRRDQLQQLELGRVDVLELVDQDQAEPRPQHLAQRRVGLQQLDRSRDEVAKVEQAPVLQAQLVRLVGRRQHAKPLACARLCREQERGWMDEVLLHQRDKGQDVARECVRPAHSLQRSEHRRIQLAKHASHDEPLLEAVEQQALAIWGVLAQEAVAEAVERRDPRFAVLVLKALVDAPRDLPRGAFREREHQDLGAAGQALTHGLLVQVDQQMRLAGAGSGEHPQWSVDFVDVEWQWVPLEWRGRPDYAGARVLKSAAPVKGRHAMTTRATSSTSSSQGHRFKSGLSFARKRNGLARTHPATSAAVQARPGRSSQTIHAAADSRHRSDAWRYGDTSSEPTMPTGITRPGDSRSLKAAASTAPTISRRKPVATTPVAPTAP